MDCCFYTYLTTRILSFRERGDWSFTMILIFWSSFFLFLFSLSFQLFVALRYEPVDYHLLMIPLTAFCLLA